jgi:hypothetical protein
VPPVTFTFSQLCCYPAFRIPHRVDTMDQQPLHTSAPTSRMPSQRSSVSTHPSPLRRRNSARSFQRNRVTKTIVGLDGEHDVVSPSQAMPRHHSQTFGDIIQRMLVRMVRSRYFRWFIDLLLASEVSSVLLFAVPYTYVVKRELMRLMLKSPLSQVTRRFGLYSALYVLMFTSCAVEYIQVRD